MAYDHNCSSYDDYDLTNSDLLKLGKRDDITISTELNFFEFVPISNSLLEFIF